MFTVLHLDGVTRPTMGISCPTIIINIHSVHSMNIATWACKHAWVYNIDVIMEVGNKT